MAKKNLLISYKKKRDFSKTEEPKGKIGKKTNKPIFVIHEHQARSHHFDLRLEDEGVLKSWAIPKGPSINPKEKHLAIRTEDHPYDYKSFEGIIPKGEYGAGPVIIWDTGTFKNLKHISLKDSIEEGAIKIWLNGKKLKGGFALVRTNFKNKDRDAPPAWLFFKLNDKEADLKHDIQKEKPRSVKSKKTIIQLEKENGKAKSR